jgi:amphi-Trp domain-containing protein
VKICEDHRTISRAELAAELHRIANQLEKDGSVAYGPAGTVTVPDMVDREVEVERTKDDTGIKFDIEFKWADQPASAPASPAT